MRRNHARDQRVKNNRGFLTAGRANAATTCSVRDGFVDEFVEHIVGVGRRQTPGKLTLDMIGAPAQMAKYSTVENKRLQRSRPLSVLRKLGIQHQYIHSGYAATICAWSSRIPFLLIRG
jgi:hypothetical protein